MKPILAQAIVLYVALFVLVKQIRGVALVVAHDVMTGIYREARMGAVDCTLPACWPVSHTEYR